MVGFEGAVGWLLQPDPALLCCLAHTRLIGCLGF